MMHFVAHHTEFIKAFFTFETSRGFTITACKYKFICARLGRSLQNSQLFSSFSCGCITANCAQCEMYRQNFV